MRFWASAALLCCFLLQSCGYHVGGRADLIPKTIHTIAIPAFTNLTVRYRLTDRLPEAIAREFLQRTRYVIVPDPERADAVLKGAIVNYNSYPTVFDQATGRASGVQVIVTLQVSLTERTTGKVLYSRSSFEVKQRYEISVSQGAYFDESGIALQRLSQDAARMLVSAILENF